MPHVVVTVIVCVVLVNEQSICIIPSAGSVKLLSVGVFIVERLLSVNVVLHSPVIISVEYDFAISQLFHTSLIFLAVPSPVDHEVEDTTIE